ncbi:major tail protein [Lysinibacillus sp. NPDC096418]|uniref:major tail protein n=1 Tax=Lysinibacillus sp. NPDC096418 TaxID=3364138 RepID=UPI003824EBBF
MTTIVNEKPQKISLKRIHYALMTDAQTETWGDVKTLTMPISLTLTPNFSEAHLDAGDRVVDQEAQLDSITIAGETADLPTEVLVDWYGHKKSAEGGVITNANDTPNAIAIGFESGSKLVWLLKAKLKPGEESNATRKKGETSYKVYPFGGEALPLIDGIIKHTVDTRDAGVTATAETFFTTVTKPSETVPTP